jgi:hypothetical protein
MRRLALLAALAAILVPAASAQARPCTRIARPGTSLRAFTASLRAGDVGCLRAGTYGRRGHIAEIGHSGRPSRRIVLQPYPGDGRPRILGQLEMSGNYVTVQGLLFDGPAGVIDGLKAIMVRIDGDHAVLTRDEIRDGQDQGVYLETAVAARVVDDYIHDNGDFADPGQANLDHGIYFASGSGLVAGNVVAHNYAYGIQLYPGPTHVTVTGNVVYGHGRGGVIVGGDPGGPQPSAIRVQGNFMADNALVPVTVVPPATPLVRDNLLAQPGGRPRVRLIDRLWG